MADTKVSALGAVTPALNDEMYLNDVSTTASAKAALSALFAIADKSGITDPVVTPDFIGQTYFNTATRRIFYATGTSSPADFVQVGATSTGALTVTITNNTGVTINQGEVLSGTTNSPTLADSDSEASSQVLGVANEDIANTDTGDVVIFGEVTASTGSFAGGEIVYVGSTPGTLVNTPPTTGFVAEVGTVMFSDPAGTVLVNPKLYGSATATEATFIHAQALTAAATNGPVAETLTYATGGYERSVMTYADGANDLTAYVDVVLPNGWNRGTVTFVPYWSHATISDGPGTDGIVWEMEIVAAGNAEDLDVAFAGTSVTSTDTGATAETLYVGPESGILTIDAAVSTISSGDMLTIALKRVNTNGANTMTASAYLHGFQMKWTRNSVDDA